MLSSLARRAATKISSNQSKRVRQAFRRIARPAWLGTLRRTTPVSDSWGYDRGTPIDRYYIERFLDEHRQDVRGCVLEVKDNAYTKRFGSKVESSHVLDISPVNRQATIVTDLARADAIPNDSFDCFILTQTLQYIPNLSAAVAHSHRILRSGGVLLATVPTVSRVIPGFGHEGDLWRFTPASCSLLFGDVFGKEQVEIRPIGNVLTSVSFLAGLAYEELSSRELDLVDEAFPVIVAVRALKR